MSDDAANREVSMADDPKTILLIEDEHNVRQLVSRLLAKSGFEVRLAKDGLDALHSLEKEREQLKEASSTANYDGLSMPDAYDHDAHDARAKTKGDGGGGEGK